MCTGASVPSSRREGVNEGLRLTEGQRGSPVHGALSCPGEGFAAALWGICFPCGNVHPCLTPVSVVSGVTESGCVTFTALYLCLCSHWHAKLP